MSMWRTIRIAGMALCLIGGALIVFSGHQTGQDEVPFAFIMFSILLPLIFFPLAMVMGISIQSINPFQNKPWTIPNWDSNFFSLTNPLHFFHTAAFFMASSAVGTLLASFFTGSSTFIIGLEGLSGSAGILLGVKLCTKIYRKKFQPKSEAVQRAADARALTWKKICGTILIFCAVALFITACLVLNHTLQFKNRAIETTGLVTSVETQQSSEGLMYYPVFSYVDTDGREHTVRSSFGSNPPQYKTQDTIQILYDPASPAKARISSFWHLYAVPVVLAAGATANLIMGIVFLLIGSATRKSHPALP